MGLDVAWVLFGAIIFACGTFDPHYNSPLEGLGFLIAIIATVIGLVSRKKRD